MTDADRERLRLRLQQSEGFRAKPYRDTVGKLTIGYGRNLDANGITKAEANMLLTHDIAIAVSACLSRFPWFGALDGVRQTVIADMMFNMGPATLAKFKATLKAVETGDYARAADHMLASLWARQVGARAQRLAQMMRTGEDTDGDS